MGVPAGSFDQTSDLGAETHLELHWSFSMKEHEYLVRIYHVPATGPNVLHKLPHLILPSTL